MRCRRVERRIERRRVCRLLTELVDIERLTFVCLRIQQRGLNLAITDVDVRLPLVGRIFDGRVRHLHVVNRRNRRVTQRVEHRDRSRSVEGVRIISIEAINCCTRLELLLLRDDFCVGRQIHTEVNLGRSARQSRCARQLQ